ncbi:MAG: pyruvate kinase [Myxococcales bacterium]|nr:pyruvate kinase [Myxococcales bacterium]
MRDYLGGYLNQSGAIDSSMRARMAQSGLTRRGRKRTKIIATLGPATDSEEVLTALCHAGMNVARLNMSHGDLEHQNMRLQLVRRVSELTDRPLAVLADLQGPKIRLGDFEAGKHLEWREGDLVVITTSPLPIGTTSRIGTSYEHLHLDVKPGDSLLVDDGKLRLMVDRVEGRDIHTRVAVGGPVSSRKGINLPGVRVSAPALTEKDRADLEWALTSGVDYIALSFVRSAEDVRAVRRHMSRAGMKLPVIAKIERPEAVVAIEEILAECDGIMVARGDLGIEISTERLPVIQKHLIARANAHGKLVITATQMLESMITSPVPTRAESSDVANAIFDGSDAIMLSAETSVGQYPVQAVSEMLRIAVEAENCPFMPMSQLDDSLLGADAVSLAVTQAAALLAEKLDAAGMVVFSSGNDRPELLSERRARRPVVVLCHDETTWRRLSMYWGVVPLRLPCSPTAPDLVERSLAESIRQGLFQPEDLVVVVQGAGSDEAPVLRVVRI